MASNTNINTDEAQRLKLLQELILTGDREQIAQLRSILESQALLSERVNPIVQQHITYLKNNFPVEFSKVIDQQIEHKLQSSQEELLNVIYPKLGTMISKYINHQFQMLKESLEENIRQALDAKTWKEKIKMRLFGIKNQEVLLDNLQQPTLEEIHVIQRYSGVLMGSAFARETFDREAVVGMLTAIKSFAEDAFQRGAENLEFIEYDTYKIMLHTHPSFYFALAISGSISSRERGAIIERLEAFFEEELHPHRQPIGGTNQADLSAKLHHYFFVKDLGSSSQPLPLSK
jgi:hypothetical protein